VSTSGVISTGGGGSGAAIGVASPAYTGSPGGQGGSGIVLIAYPT
jgi:hypothetical protein